jgi:glycosyltransferase involved in cell wall biosynthesis
LRIIYFYQYFSTSKGSWGTRVHEFTREWVGNNPDLEVKVITSLYYKSDLQSEKFWSAQRFDGVDVDVLGIKINNKDGFLKRIFSFLAYAIFSSGYALFGKYDVAIASSGPITVGLPGLIAKRIRGKKLVFEVRDLWPQGAIELGVIKNPILINWAKKIEMSCYKNSDLIVTLSLGMRDEVKLKVPNKKVISITNAANIELFSTQKSINLKDFNLKKGEYAIYAGNIGKVNNVEWMYQSAMQLTKLNSSMKIVMIGDGQLKNELQNRKNLEGNDNLVFLPLIPKTELVGLIQNAIISLVPLANTPILKTSSPNKLFESLAAGIPVIITTEGWMKELVEEENLGYYVDPDRSESLTEFLTQFAEPNEEDKLRIREFATKNFDKRILAYQYLKEINEIL